MRRYVSLFSMIVLAMVLVACGGDDDNDEPTVAPTTDVTPDTQVQPTTESTTASTAPGASPAASPVVDLVASPAAFPIIGAAATPAESPAGPDVASPVAPATPAVSSTPVAAGLPVGEGAAAEEQATESRLLSGTITLPGTVNERFVISGDGCVGLGRYAGVQAGQQVVVREGSGAIVAVTTLAATDSQVECAWTFEAEVPAAEFYTVSLPLIVEYVFADEDVVRSNGELQVTLP